MMMVIGLLLLVGIVFIVLKLLAIINWSWIWVTCPVWAAAAIAIIAGIFHSILVEIAKYADKKEKEKK